MLLLPTASPTSILAETFSASISNCSSFPSLPPLNGTANKLFLLLSLCVSIAYISFPSSPKIPQTLLLFSVISRSLSTPSTSLSEMHTTTHFFPGLPILFSASEENCQLWQYLWALFLFPSLRQDINSGWVVYSYKAIVLPSFPSP